MATKRKIKCIELNKVFDSVQEASKELNISKSLISMCINKKRDTANGYHFTKVKGKHKKELNMFTPISDTISKQFSVQTVDTQGESDSDVHTNVHADVHTNSVNVTEKSVESDFVESEYLDTIAFLLKEYCNYRAMTMKKKDEFFAMKVKYDEYAALNNKYIALQLENKQLQQQYNKLQAQQLNNHPQSNDELRAEFDKILEEKRAKWENLVEMYESVCNERDGLTERIQIIINAPEYKSFAERESREGRERAKKEKEAWNNIDNINDEFSMFESAPRRRTITDYEDERLG
jgi:hypothetical protein